MSTRLIAVLLALCLAGCGGSSNSALNPAFQPEVANNTDNFQFQSTGVTNVTQTLRYTWVNTGIRATIDQACAITAGTAVVNVRDSQGAMVYSAGLQNNGSFTSVAGQTGNWQIEVVLSGVSGTLNFRVQKTP
jgi:hypothetical protein